MGQESEELRADIERRRESMTGTIDAIEDRVVPGRIIERRRQAAREWVGGVRDRVMGPPQTLKHQASSAADRMGEGMSQMTDKISDAPAQLQQATAGSPLIAGAVAFGIGALIAAVLPRNGAGTTSHPGGAASGGRGDRRAQGRGATRPRDREGLGTGGRRRAQGVGKRSCATGRRPSQGRRPTTERHHGNRGPIGVLRVMARRRRPGAILLGRRAESQAISECSRVVTARLVGFEGVAMRVRRCDATRPTRAPYEVEPLVHPGRVRAPGRAGVARIDLDRQCLRLRAGARVADRRTGRCGRDPFHDRRVDGVARRAGPHHHDGRRAARDGSVLARIVQTFLRDKPSQIAVGLFIATFVHAMLALREVHFDDGGSVPGLADPRRLCARGRQRGRARVVRPPHRPIAARLGVDRARRHPTPADCSTRSIPSDCDASADRPRTSSRLPAPES